MKGTDRAIIGALGVVVLAGAFWMLLLSPKRQEASELDDEVKALEAQVAEQEQAAAFGEQARDQFPKYYGKLVVLGKAVPEQADSASLMVQLSDISADADVEFRGIKLSEGGTGAPAPAPAPTSPVTAAQSPSVTDAPGETATTAAPAATTPSTGTAAATTPGATTTATAPAPATEAAASTLPIGASVGPAGLPTIAYELDLRARFFDLADFIAGVDDLVGIKGGDTLTPDGRLLTISGFAFSQDARAGFPFLRGSFLVASYSAPATQGLTGGATVGGPAPTTPAATVTPTSAEVTP